MTKQTHLNDLGPIPQPESQQQNITPTLNTNIHRSTVESHLKHQGEANKKNAYTGILDSQSIVANFRQRMTTNIAAGEALLSSGNVPANVNLEEFRKVLNIYRKTLREIRTLESSSFTYNVVYAGEAGGVTRFNPTTGYIDVVIQRGRDTNHSNGLIAHELKHAYQFEKGKISFTPQGFAGSLTDITDEVEAYNRQSYIEKGVLHRNWTADDVVNFGNANGIPDYALLPRDKRSFSGRHKKRLIRDTKNAARQNQPPPEIYHKMLRYYRR